MTSRGAKKKLGRPIKLYRSSSIKFRDLLTWFLPALLLPLVLLGYGLWRVYLGFTRFGSAAANSWGQPWFIAAGLGLIPVTLLTIRHIQSVRRRVILYENGLRFIHVSRKRKALHWRQISGVTTDSTRYSLLGHGLKTRHRVVLFPTTGKPIQLDDRLQNLPNLIQRIKESTHPLILPNLRATLHAGQWLYFGAVKFNRNTLSTRNQEIPWNQIKNIHIQSGSLVIDLDRVGSLKIPISQIHNLEIFLKLIDQDIIVW